MRLVARPVRFGFLALLLAAWLLPAPAVAQDTPASDLAALRSEGDVSAGPTAASPARSLRGIEVSSSPGGGDRVVLRLDSEPRFHLFEVEDPYRVVIDLEGTVNRVAHGVTVDSRQVHQVRAGQYQAEPSPVARVVLDMNGRHAVDAHPEGQTLVVDVAGAQPAPAAAAPAPPAEPVGAEPPAPPAEEAPASADPEPARLAVGSLPGAPAGSVREVAVTPESVAPSPERRETPPAALAPAVTQVQSGDVVFEKNTITGEQVSFTGKKISLNLVDADIRQVFRLFHEISGLNFVLDPAVTGKVTIVVDEVPWDQALDLILKNNSLDKVYENNVIRIASTQKLAQESSARKTLKEAKELEADTVTITRPLSYAKAKDTDAIIKTGVLLSARGKSFYDERTNTIIVTDVPTKIEPIDKLLTNLDQKTTQVMIEARIVETTRTFSQDLGIRWGFSGEKSEAKGNALDWRFPHRASADWDLDLSRNPGITQLALSFGNISDSFTLDIALDALEQEGQARILSAPKIATRNNEEAEIEQGVRIPIVNTTATEINVEFVSASLKLKVTPQITAEGTVLLDLEVANDTPDMSIVTDNGTPGIRTQRARTAVLVTDGGTTVIGGIFVVNEANSEFGVPFFRKIPFFGWLFKSRNITNENRELLVFVTPKILKG